MSQIKLKHNIIGSDLEESIKNEEDLLAYSSKYKTNIDKKELFKENQIEQMVIKKRLSEDSTSISQEYNNISGNDLKKINLRSSDDILSKMIGFDEFSKNYIEFQKRQRKISSSLCCYYDGSDIYLSKTQKTTINLNNSHNFIKKDKLFNNSDKMINNYNNFKNKSLNDINNNNLSPNLLFKNENYSSMNNKNKNNYLKNNTENKKYENNNDLKNLPFGINNVEIKVETEDGYTAVEVIGADYIPDEDTDVMVTVTAEDGTKRNIIFHVKRYYELSKDCTLKYIKINDKEISKFDRNNFKYTVKTAKETTSLKMDVEPNDGLHSIYEIIGNKDLKNKSVITIKVTAENGDVCTYNITVKKSSNIWIPILIIIVIIGILIGVGYYVYGYMKRSKDQYKYE